MTLIEPVVSPKERIQYLKERTQAWEVVQKPYIGRRLYHALRGLASTSPAMPWMKRKAAVLASIVENMEAEIFDGELVVGYNYYGSDDGQGQEVSLHHRDAAGKEHLLAYLQQGELDEAQISFILDTLDHIERWTTHTPYIVERPPQIDLAEDEGLLRAWATAENHTVLGYEKVLKLGFAGICAEIDEGLNHLDWSDPAAPHKKLLLESLQKVAQAACTLGRRYAAKASQLLETCTDAGRAAELETIRQTTLQAPEFPARSFREAVQSLWFAHIINTWEDGINANSLGRIDQILYPYYVQDIADGRLNDAEAFELLSCLWLKLYREYDVQQVTLGGVDAQGQDATNELTYLMLDVTESLDLIRCMGIRLYQGSPDKLLSRALQIVHKGKGVPFFFNDEALVPALTANGIALADARDYANIGCVETTIPGKANPHAVSNQVNLLKCLELALNNGTSMTTGQQVGPRTGEIGEMHTLEDVIAAYQKQAEYFIKLACYESNRCELSYALTLPLPYKSLLTEGCLDTGRDFNAGGAIYNYHETMAMGIPNVADSLAALDELVFQKQKYTLAEAVEQLRSNFEDEKARREFLNGAPKYGNNIEAVDSLAARVFDHFCDVLQRQKNPYGQGYFAQPFTFLWHVDMGAKTAATPDGRRKGEILAYSLSPMQGRDHSGLTAMINSLARLPHHRAAGCTSAIVEIDPVLFTEENLPLMVSFLRTAIQKGVGQLQFNVINAETLIKAQLEPEKYRNLAVRVSGFSQRFCLLSKELQDHIIARTKHTY
jgi:pyruvate formate-lyase/glycerol dehydratase family glycyl radical enzyme